MKKKQTGRLSEQHLKSKGAKGIFAAAAQLHDGSVKHAAKLACAALGERHPSLEFRHRETITKREINQRLNQIDSRLGVSTFVDNAAIKPDGGIIEVKDGGGRWRVVLVSEAKHQGRDIDNISKGILVGRDGNQDLMVAGNAIERAHKNVNEMRNLMLDEKHFPYALFLQGSNFLTETITALRPDGRAVELRADSGTLNRIDRVTAANYSMPVNQNCCANIFISAAGEKLMLQAVSIYTKATSWTSEEMLTIMLDVAGTALKIIKPRRR